MTAGSDTRRAQVRFPDPLPPVIRRPVPLRRILVGMAVLLALLAVVAVPAYIANYQPLAPGGMGTAPRCLEDLGTFHPFKGESFGVARTICTERGEVVRWGFSLRNDGPFDVRIERVGGNAIGELGSATVRMSPGDLGTGAELARVPFEPFTLRSGHERILEFERTFRRDCELGGVRFIGFAITFDVLGLTRRDHVGFPTQIHLEC